MNDKYINRIMALVVTVIVILVPGWAQSQDNSGSSSAQNFKQEELAQMLAPIALYPDALLSQVLMAASYPFEVVEADRFLANNPGLNGDALDNALKEKDWDVSVLSLCYYPKVLSMMTENLNWTARLGDAFINQQQEVMDTVQELRAKAYAQGNITTTPEQNVIVEERIIRIETSSPDYMYVPVYDPYVIYGPWWYPAYMPFPIFYPGVAVIGPRIAFSPRVYVGFGVFGWSAFNWRSHNMMIVNIDRTKRFNRNVNVYRGVEHSPWRPDRERRFVREQRAREIPQYRPVVRPLAPVPARRPGGKIVAPPKSDPGRDRKIEPRDRNVGVQPPARIQPQPERKDVIERGKVEKREQPDRKVEPRDRNVGVQPPVQIQPQPERKDVIERGKVEKQEQPDRQIAPRNRNVEVKPPVQVKPQPERKPLDRTIEPRDRNVGVQPPAQIQPRPERKDVIERDKGEKRERLDDTRNAPREGRGESDRGNERGSGGGREGRR